MDETRIALEALITERLGMVAKNEQNAYLDRGLAYGDEDFQRLADRMRKLAIEQQEIGEPGSLPARVYLVVQQRADTSFNVRDAIMGVFAVAEDSLKWINHQHDPAAYFMEPLNVIREGG